MWHWWSSGRARKKKLDGVQADNVVRTCCTVCAEGSAIEAVQMANGGVDDVLWIIVFV